MTGEQGDVSGERVEFSLTMSGETAVVSSRLEAASMNAVTPPIFCGETAVVSSRLEATFPLRYNKEQIVFY